MRWQHPVLLNSIAMEVMMSSKVLLIPNGDKYYAIPTEVCEQYELSGERLKTALRGHRKRSP
jgi:hypothetical protein